MRASKEDVFMKQAEAASERSTCLRRHVGAVIVKDGHVVSTGYNGAPVGAPHCEKCLREEMNIPSGQRHELCRGVHAEQNAIIQAAKYGPSIDGSIIYVTNQPCSICAKMICNAGIKEVIFLGSYPDEMTEKVFKESGVLLTKFNR